MANLIEQPDSGLLSHGTEGRTTHKRCWESDKGCALDEAVALGYINGSTIVVNGFVLTQASCVVQPQKDGAKEKLTITWIGPDGPGPTSDADAFDDQCNELYLCKSWWTFRSAHDEKTTDEILFEANDRPSQAAIDDQTREDMGMSDDPSHNSGLAVTNQFNPLNRLHEEIDAIISWHVVVARADDLPATAAEAVEKYIGTYTPFDNDKIGNDGFGCDTPSGLVVGGDASIQTSKNLTDLTDNGDGTWSVTYQVTVTNSGTVPLTGVSVFDDVIGQFGGFNPTNFNAAGGTFSPSAGWNGTAGSSAVGAAQTLAVGTSKTVIISFDVSPAPGVSLNPLAGNVATADATGPGGTPIGSQNSTAVGPRPKINEFYPVTVSGGECRTLKCVNIDIQRQDCWIIRVAEFTWKRSENGKYIQGENAKHTTHQWAGDNFQP